MLVAAAPAMTARAVGTDLIVTASIDAAGRQASSANYTTQGSMGGIAGLSTVASPSETNKTGYVGQIDYVTGLNFASTFTDNGSTQNLNATQTLDDGTTQALGGSGASWIVSSGTLPAGLALDSATGIISGTPTTFGPYSFTILVSDGLENSATQTFSGTLTETFADWEDSYHITDSPISTPQHDGVPTLFKYLYNINPTRAMDDADRAALPVVGMTTSGGLTYLTLTYRQFAGQTGLTIQLQTCSDLKSWVPIVQPGQPATPPPFSQQLGTDSETGDPIMEVGALANGLKTQFIRLSVSLP
jgi:hypothetical protein